MNKNIEIYGNTVLSDILERNNQTVLEYYRICDSLIDQEDSKPYGIGVIKKTCDEMELNLEQREFKNIFSNENEANKMLSVLLANQVTPVALKDILEDFVLV